MSQINTVLLVGRAGQDPEVKYFESGTVVAKLSLAVKRPSKNNETDWFDLEAWAKTAETMANYVKKGSLLGIEASLNFETWTDKNTGEKRSKPVFKVERLNLLSSKAESEAQQEEN